MKKLLLLIIPLLISCQKTIKDIDFNAIKEPCELIDASIIICNEAKELRERYGTDLPITNKDYHSKKAEIENAWFDGINGCMARNRWHQNDIKYCERYNELMRLKLSEGGNPDF
jgi:hypothetical protein